MVISRYNELIFFSRPPLTHGVFQMTDTAFNFYSHNTHASKRKQVITVCVVIFAVVFIFASRVSPRENFDFNIWLSIDLYMMKTSQKSQN